MDYQLNVFPSSERELQNIKADNSSKQIKIIQENKLPALYKKTFGPAVSKYNERAISGRLIDDYYKSIVASNIPEVYKLSIVIRYEMINKNDPVMIQKAFMDFKKLLEKKSYLCLVSTYILSFDEYKELQIFFYPVSDGYATGLSVRNDLIDVTKRLCDVKENINILKAMPIFVNHIDELFDQVNGGQFISQSELEARARNITSEDPMILHAIAAETLKSQMEELKKTAVENQSLKESITSEKTRIQYDLEWIKTAEQMIYEAEEVRLQEEARLVEERAEKEKARRLAEAQRREEERLQEETRRLEAKRLAEQAMRDLELRKQMEKQENTDTSLDDKTLMGQDEFVGLLEKHLEWQADCNINEQTIFDELSDDIKNDVRRMRISSAHIRDVAYGEERPLIGVELNDCEFSNCNLSICIGQSHLHNCIFTRSNINELRMDSCTIANIDADGIKIENAQIASSKVSDVSLKEASIVALLSAPTNTFTNCDFTGSTLKECDIKNNTFMSCNFDGASFVSCDMRNSSFKSCQMESVRKYGSAFRGASFK
jgi:uncharacterized protein YjbI with pentapeptide repeats